MRKLEVLLIGGALVVSFLTYVGEATPIVAAVLVLVLVAHVLIESPRWQLLPVYLVTTVAVSIAGLQAGPTGLLNQLVFWVGFLVIVLGVALAIGLPVVTFPHPSGPYPVGTSVFHLAQLGRPEIHSTDPNATRQLMLQIWYPAEDSLHPLADYLPDHQIGSRALTRAFHMPRFGLDHFDLMRPTARMDPPVAEAEDAFPVLLFSHGRSGTRIQNTFQIEELCSYGYVVAAVDHPYGAGYTVYPDGQVIDYDVSIFGNDSPRQAGLVIDEWVKDFQCVLDTLQDFDSDEDGQFANSLDLEQVGVFGHSAGGGAAFEFCFRDERCGPVLCYDPWLIPTSEEAISDGLDHPILVLKQDVPLGPMSDARLDALVANTSATSYVYEIEGAKHLDFNDFKLLVPAMEWIGMTGSIDGEKLKEILNETTRAFFDVHLRGYPASPILSEVSSFPEARRRPS